MPYDLFISYAHQGDKSSREVITDFVTRLHRELESDFRRRFNRDLEIFFDKEDIKDFDHWQVRCHRALRDSRFFLACLSRSYLRSDACRWEWEEWCRHELEHGLVGQGAASLWFVKFEDLDTPEDTALLRRWKGDLLQRFHIQCHEWRHDDHGNFLDVTARSELQQLTEHVAQRLRLLTLDRARRGNLPWPNTNFVGREPELASLRAVLLDVPEPSPAGIHGVGGMGKTALAQALAYKETDAFPGGCWLLRCEGRDRLLAVFRTLVSDLDIELTDKEKLDDAKAVRRVFDVFCARGPALFLLDNVEHPALLAQEQMKLLADQPWTRVLYTTRLAPDDFIKAGATIRPLDLDRLPENQAVDLIRRYQSGQAFASPEHEAAAREIVRELSGLTLAVETAAVYLGQCDPRATEPEYAVDVQNYLNKLREDLKTGGGEGVMSQLREVTATLRPTLARLDAPAQTVLQIASLLAPDGVALPWVRAIAGQSHPELAVEAATGESDSWTQLVRGLIGMRLFQPTAEPRVVALHRILQRVLEHELLERDTQNTQTENLVQFLRSRALFLWTDWVKPENRWEIKPMTDCAYVWLQRSSDLGSYLANQIHRPLESIGELAEVENLLRRAVEHTRQVLGEAHGDHAACLSNLALLLKHRDCLQEAERLARSALAIDEKIFGPDHPIVARDLNNIGIIIADSTNHEEYERLLRRVLSIFQGAFGGKNAAVATALCNLGHFLCAYNRFPEAETCLREALRIDEELVGADHPEVVTPLNNLAQLLLRTGRISEGEVLTRRVIGVCEKVHGSDHPLTALALNNLACLLKDQERFVDAEPLMRRALVILEKKLDSRHLDLIRARGDLGSLLRAAGNYPEAELHFRAAIFAAEGRFGFDHPTIRNNLGELAGVLMGRGQTHEAETFVRRQIDIDKRVFGEKSPSYATELVYFSVVLIQNNKLGEAEETLHRGLAILGDHLSSEETPFSVTYNFGNEIYNELRQRRKPGGGVLSTLLEIILWGG